MRSCRSTPCVPNKAPRRDLISPVISRLKGLTTHFAGALRLCLTQPATLPTDTEMPCLALLPADNNRISGIACQLFPRTGYKHSVVARRLRLLPSCIHLQQNHAVQWQHSKPSTEVMAEKTQAFVRFERCQAVELGEVSHTASDAGDRICRPLQAQYFRESLPMCDGNSSDRINRHRNEDRMAAGVGSFDIPEFLR